MYCYCPVHTSNPIEHCEWPSGHLPRNPALHWKNPERKDMPFTPFVLRVLSVNGHCKVSIGVLFINSNSFWSSLYLDFPIQGILNAQEHCLSPARSAMGVQWAFSAPKVGHYTVGLQCALQGTVRPLHFELGQQILVKCSTGVNQITL